VATIAKAFAMRVLAWTPRLTTADSEKLGVWKADSLPELFAESDIVSIHAPLNETTRGLVGAALLSHMRPDALLINTARAPIVDEAALIAALQANRIGGAAIDVFNEEPLGADHPFRSMANVLPTPHLGYVTGDVYGRFYADVVEDIDAWLRGAPVRQIGAGRGQ
jgi:phosphoglycerate dehydrogenase-like enzyme